MKRLLILCVLCVTIVMQIHAQMFRVGTLKFTISDRINHLVEASGETEKERGELNIPKSIKEIGETAFTSTGFTCITFMGSPIIYNQAFMHRWHVKEIKCYSKTPPKLKGNPFESCPFKTLAVPPGSLQNYKS